MHKYFRGITLLVALLLIGTLLAACGGPAASTTPTNAPAEQPTAATTGGTTSGTNLQLIWFDWQPCQALGQLVKTYKDATVDMRCVPIGQWHDQIFTDFAAKGGADIVILDSQYIGEAVKGSHIVDLTDWMKTNIETDDYIPAALSAYGEYPAGSGKFYGVAAEGDTHARLSQGCLRQSGAQGRLQGQDQQGPGGADQVDRSA